MKKLLRVFLMLTLMLSLAACGQKAPAWQEQYDLGVKYLSEGNYEEAVIAFTAAIEIDPKQPDAYMGLADVYTAQGDIEQAAAVLKQALEAAGENDALRSALDALRAGAPDGASELVTVEGYIIDNADEYEEQWALYREQYQKPEENAVCSIEGSGIRFSQPAEVTVDGQQATISEAGMRVGDCPELYESNMEGRPLRMTGYFYRSHYTEELNGPFEDDGRIDYYYRPNGDYLFYIAGYKEIG